MGLCPAIIPWRAIQEQIKWMQFVDDILYIRLNKLLVVMKTKNLSFIFRWYTPTFTRSLGIQITKKSGNHRMVTLWAGVPSLQFSETGVGSLNNYNDVIASQKTTTVAW